MDAGAEATGHNDSFQWSLLWTRVREVKPESGLCKNSPVLVLQLIKERLRKSIYYTNQTPYCNLRKMFVFLLLTVCDGIVQELVPDLNQPDFHFGPN
jgi:hypothetical protein